MSSLAEKVFGRYMFQRTSYKTELPTMLRRHPERPWRITSELCQAVELVASEVGHYVAACMGSNWIQSDIMCDVRTDPILSDIMWCQIGPNLWCQMISDQFKSDLISCDIKLDPIRSDIMKYQIRPKLSDIKWYQIEWNLIWYRIMSYRIRSDPISCYIRSDPIYLTSNDIRSNWIRSDITWYQIWSDPI